MKEPYYRRPQSKHNSGRLGLSRSCRILVGSWGSVASTRFARRHSSCHQLMKLKLNAAFYGIAAVCGLITGSLMSPQAAAATIIQGSGSAYVSWEAEVPSPI